MRRMSIGLAAVLSAASIGLAAPLVGIAETASPLDNGKPARPKRGKRQQARAKRKPNRLHISRRVRRQHRRAA